MLLFVILGLRVCVVKLLIEIEGILLELSFKLRKKIEVFEVVLVVRNRWLLVILVESWVLRLLILVISKDFVFLFLGVICFCLLMLKRFYLKCIVLEDCFFVKYFIKINWLWFWFWVVFR